MKEKILSDIAVLEAQAISMLEVFSLLDTNELKDTLVHWATNIIGYSQGAAYLNAKELSESDVKEIADRQEAAIKELAKWAKLHKEE